LRYRRRYARTDCRRVYADGAWPTGAVAALVHHPDCRDAARGGLEHLLTRESKDGAPIGREVARLSGHEEVRGFITHFAEFDAAFVLSLAAAAGASREDSRIAAIIDRLLPSDHVFVAGSRHRGVSAWITYDVLHSVRHLSGDWIGRQIHTPYRSYRRESRRY
jgi:hypothetical protein